MKTATELYSRLESKFLSLYSKITDWNVGADIRSLLESAAVLFQEVWFRLDGMYADLFLTTARGDALRWRGQELGVDDKEVQAAACPSQQFTGAAGTVVPKNTLVTTNPDVDPMVEFTTDQAATIPTGATVITAAITCRETGLAGNVPAGRIAFLPQSVAGISATINLEAATGGQPEEDDESYRQRSILRPYESAAGAIEDYFRSAALRVRGVAEARLKEGGRGPGSVVLYVWSKDSTGKLVPGSATLVATVQSYLADPLRRPLCTQVYVEQPAGAIVDVSILLRPLSGYTFASTSTLVAAAVRAFFADLAPGEDLVLFQLSAACSLVAGIEDLRIVDPAANVTADPTEVLLLGRLSIQEFDATRGQQGQAW